MPSSGCVATMLAALGGTDSANLACKMDLNKGKREATRPLLAQRPYQVWVCEEEEEEEEEAQGLVHVPVKGIVVYTSI